MELNNSLLISGFALGLVMGVTADLINKLISAFARWALSR